jgi:hypothetical protein
VTPNQTRPAPIVAAAWTKADGRATLTLGAEDVAVIDLD